MDQKRTYTTDSSLLRNVKEGNETAWQQFYEKYSGMICYIGRKRNLTLEECNDLMSEVMTIFWKKMDLFFYERDRGKFRSYLGRIAEYCAMQLFCRREPQALGPAAEELEYPEDVNAAMMKEWQEQLIKLAMEELKEIVDTETYQVFYMSFVQNCPVKEISFVTRKTANNIYVIRSRCLAKLALLVKKYRYLDEGNPCCHSHRK